MNTNSRPGRSGASRISSTLMPVRSSALRAVLPIRDLAAARAAMAIRFGRIAAGALGVLALSGALLALMHLTRPLDLLATAYGQSLAAKSVLVLGLVTLAVIASRLVRLSARATVWRAELALLGAVLAAAGVLISRPPPR